MADTEKFQLVCNECGNSLKPASRADFEECGALFRHVHRDPRTVFDLDGGHSPVPVVKGPDGDEEVWTSAYTPETKT